MKKYLQYRQIFNKVYVCDRRNEIVIQKYIVSYINALIWEIHLTIHFFAGLFVHPKSLYLSKNYLHKLPAQLIRGTYIMNHEQLWKVREYCMTFVLNLGHWSITENFPKYTRLYKTAFIDDHYTQMEFFYLHIKRRHTKFFLNLIVCAC